MAQWVKNQTSIHEDTGSIPGLAQCIKNLTSLQALRCKLQIQLGSGIAVAVVCRPAAAAPLQPLAWEHPYAAGATLKKKKKNDRKNNHIRCPELGAARVKLVKKEATTAT